MSHPDALLAEYVDGALAEGERAVVERHLDGCERCREEVALARAASSALASVAEAPAPGNLGDGAIAEARRRAAGAPAAAAPPGKPGWYRWAGAAAGIAAAVLLLTLVIPHVGTAPTREAAGGAAAQSAAAPPATTVEAQNVDYDLAGVEALATSYAAGRTRRSDPTNKGRRLPRRRASRPRNGSRLPAPSRAWIAPSRRPLDRRAFRASSSG